MPRTVLKMAGADVRLKVALINEQDKVASPEVRCLFPNRLDQTVVHKSTHTVFEQSWASSLLHSDQRESLP